MLKASWKKYRLYFKFVARTSRSSMRYKDTYFIKVWDDACPNVVGVGECNLFKGLSADDKPDYEQILTKTCVNIGDYLPAYSSIIFGLETAISDFKNGGKHLIFPSRWTNTPSSPITINGLIWMGSKQLMIKRVREKLENGFSCLKLKIGGIDFAEETSILKSIRKEFSAETLCLRLDANGAFSPGNALEKLNILSQFQIHSIEQPIKANQIDAMAWLCESSPIPIALDEELIGVSSKEEKAKLLDAIKPQFIILKPALCGGFSACDEYLQLAAQRHIGVWATSALESNIGLNAIAQWTSSRLSDSGNGHSNFPQGLGTGMLYKNNIHSPITMHGEKLFYDNSLSWGNI